MGPPEKSLSGLIIIICFILFGTMSVCDCELHSTRELCVDSLNAMSIESNQTIICICHADFPLHPLPTVHLSNVSHLISDSLFTLHDHSQVTTPLSFASS